MLEAVEIETRPNPQWSIVWLHGLGADGHDFEPVVPEIVRPDWPSLRFVFPHAPVRAVTINGGVRMRAWYDILGLEIAHRQDEAGVRDSVRRVGRVIQHEVARGIPERRILVAGFSQGGAIALSLGVRAVPALAGVIALSTYLPLADKLEPELSPESRTTPIWMGHGSLDPVVSQSLGSMSRDWLKSHGYDVDWHSYPMPHSLCAEEIRDLSLWMGARFTQ